MGYFDVGTGLLGELGFTTPRFVTIKDWRLALLNLCMTGIILGYVLWSLVDAKTYLLNEIPFGATTQFAYGKPEFYVATLTEEHQGEGPLCPAVAAGDYEFYYDQYFIYNNSQCSFLKSSDLAFKRVDGMFIVTSVEVNKGLVLEGVNQLGGNNENLTSCPQTISTNNNDGFSLDFQFSSEFPAECEYTERSVEIPVAAEELNMVVAHSYDTSAVGHSGPNPKTFVRRAGTTENIKVFEEGSSVDMQVKEWLSLAGVDLDLRTDEQQGFERNFEGMIGTKGFSVDVYPKTRLTGVKIRTMFKYYNYGQSMAAEGDPNSDGVYCILELEPVLEWTAIGDAVVRSPITQTLVTDDGQYVRAVYFANDYRYGIYFEMSHSGIVGKFDFVFFLGTILSGIVLLNTAQTISLFVARYGMGQQSQMYADFIYEPLDLVKTYARFAIQALGAAQTFHHYDKDGSGELDLDEMKGLLGGIFPESRLSLTDRHYLAKFVCNAADGATADDSEKDGKISVAEWMNQATDPQASVGQFLQLMHQAEGCEAKGVFAGCVGCTDNIQQAVDEAKRDGPPEPVSKRGSVFEGMFKRMTTGAAPPPASMSKDDSAPEAQV